MTHTTKHQPLRSPLRAASLAMLALGVSLLGACGLDVDDEPAAPTASVEVPASATASATAWTQFTASLPASETAEPLRMNAAEPPTSETADPQPI